MQFISFNVRERQNVFTMGFYSAIENILNKNFNLSKSELIEHKFQCPKPDFITENKHYFVIKFTTLDFNSFKKYLELSQEDQRLVEAYDIGSNKLTYITNIVHHNNILENNFVTVNGKEFEILTIENLLYLCGDNPILRTMLMSSLNISTESIIPQPLSDEFRAELKNDTKMLSPFSLKNLFFDSTKSVEDPSGNLAETTESTDQNCQNLINELSNLKPGKKFFQEYEKLCKTIVDTIFMDNIEPTISQELNNNGLYRFDLVASLKNNPESFWKFIYDKFNSCFILFECKNYSGAIGQGEIYTTERYLYNNALRNVAIILTRKGIDENGVKACQGVLKEHGKLILVLNDKDIIEYIKTYEDKVNDTTKISPSDLLLKKAKDFLLALDK